MEGNGKKDTVNLREDKCFSPSPIGIIIRGFL